ncbi:MAG: PqqD family peptide modification chaperone, partial [Firmicutes bacterium]|nr:PqqD family peptide modification chaperone [Bacillota bacterium]
MVHRYQNNGYNIVLDSNSGSVHVVDPLAYDVIGLFEDHSEEEIIEAMLEKYADTPDVTEDEIRETLEDIRTLKKEYKIFTKDIFADAAPDLKSRQSVIKALCLHVAHDCNLRCSYCFACEAAYQGETALMSFEVGKRALDFLIENSGTRRNLEVDFFGG